MLVRIAVVPALALAAWATLPAVPALAATSSCQPNGTTGVSVNVMLGDPVTLSTGAAGQIMLTSPAQPGGVQCTTGPYASPVPATTSNVDSIAISGGDDVTIDLHRTDPAVPAFTPGLTPEPNGLPEILFGFSSWTSDLTIEGSDQPDDIRAAGDGSLRLNGDDDADLVFSSGASPASITVRGNGGDDLIDLSSRNAYDNTTVGYRLDGGPGNDVVHGWKKIDVLHGGSGNDELAGGGGNDSSSYLGGVYGDDGDDTLLEDGTSTEQTFSPTAVPDGGVGEATVYQESDYRASALRVRVNVAHAAPETLQLTLTPPSGGPVQLVAAGGPHTGANFAGTVFEPAATTPVAGTSAPYTGRFQAVGDLGALLANGVYGPWTLTATDTDGTDGVSGTILSWELSLVGSGLSAPTDAAYPSGDDGSDTLDGGPGTDTLSYAAHSAGITLTASDPVSGTTAGAGGPSGGTDYYAGVERVVATDSADTFHGSSGADDLAGGGGNDSFHGGGGDDQIACGDGEDQLDYADAPSGVDVDLATGTVSGGAGADQLTTDCEDVVGSASADVLTGNASANTLVGGAGDDTLTGADGDDRLDAGAGADHISGDAGNDVLTAEQDTDADVYAGGPGLDGVVFADYGHGLHVTLDGVADDGVSGATPQDVGDVDNAQADLEGVYGTPWSDLITGNGADDVLIGGAGNDVLNGLGGSNTLIGGTVFGFSSFADPLAAQPSGEDTVSYGQSPVGVVVDLPGHNALHGAATDSLQGISDVVGSPYADTIQGDGGDNRIQPGLGDDVVHGGGGADTFLTASTPDGADTWDSGSDAGDTVDYSARSAGVQLSKDGLPNDGAPGEGDDIGAGTDVLRGGQGADTLVGGQGADTIYGGGGNDAVSGRGGADTLDGGSGNDSLNGGDDNDHLQGDEGDDTLIGGAGSDLLEGDRIGQLVAGADTLMGGTGDDDEFGGPGNDRFVEGDSTGANGSDLLRGEAGTDTVSYNGRAAGVTVSLNGTFDDGAAYEQDNVSTDVESIEGTAYNDRLVGSAAANRLTGLGGNDVLWGLAGNDVLDGGTGNDTFVAASTADGADSVYGGTGLDAFDYRARTGGVTVTLDGLANDGAYGEADNVRGDVEVVYGGAGSDRLTGSNVANRLYGGNGNDVLVGLLGADYLDGGAGNDAFYAKDGVKDTLVGGTGTDTLKSHDSTDVRSSIP